MSLTTTLGGLSGSAAVLPLSGTASGATTLVGQSIDVTNLGVSQLFPRAGTVTSITARFSTTIAATLIGSTVTVQAQLYTGAATSNVLTAVAGTTCTLSPGYTGIVAISSVATCMLSTNVPISAGTQGAVVVSATAPGLSLVNTLTGFTSVSMAYA